MILQQIIRRRGNKVEWMLDGVYGDSAIGDGVAVDAVVDNGTYLLTPEAIDSIIEEVNEWLGNNPPVYTRSDVEKAWKDGYREALTLFAHWKDGVQYVGSCGYRLLDALTDLEKL